MTGRSCAVTLSCSSKPASEIVKYNSHPFLLHLKLDFLNISCICVEFADEYVSVQLLKVLESQVVIDIVIVNAEEFEQPCDLQKGFIAYPWHIDTKYYTADVHVCTLEEKHLGIAEFAESVQAVILYFDSGKNDGLIEAEEWEPFIKEFDPDIRILLCENCEENPSIGISKLSAQEWCIARGYELVELDPLKDDGCEEDDDFLETTGAARILQALHAHTWPELIMKDGTTSCSRSIQSLLVNPVANLKSLSPSGLLASLEMGDDGLSQELQNLRLNQEALNDSDVLGLNIVDEPPDSLGSGGTTDDFFRLFQNLADMKERVSGMNTDDRKACAEQVVRAFWGVMGGDSEELSDTSDDEK
ncbi:Alpha- and gamma-adaptin-binding protein p34 [Frankliniella fusca]|uniref:Alpha- and gamma-adaptin-binding protein p34 n=1 Tax=Frankliniella fusca TaxID=407009 RepID=A0AAE1HZ84_9NEOP|nr:Alpha- and gamma-adaptin-binding protein p34 [Frankliniella fusca]